MARQVPYSGGLGLVLEEDATFNADDSSFSEAGQRSDVPRPENSGALAVSSGGPAPAADVRVRTQRGGIVGLDRPPSFVWQPVGEDEWFGADEPGSMYHFRIIQNAGTGLDVEAAAVEDAIRLQDGAVLLASLEETSGVSLAAVHRVEPGGAANRYVVWDGAPVSSVVAVDQLRSGRIVHLTAYSDVVANELQVRMHYSDDGGETWALGSDGALISPIDRDGTDWVPQSLSAASIDGVLSVFLSARRPLAAVDDYREQAIQWVSRDGGSNLALVWQTDETSPLDGQASHRDVCVRATVGHSLGVAWIDEDGVTRFRRLGDAYDALDAGEAVSVDDTRAAVASAAGRAGQALTVAEDGRLYIAGPAAVSSGTARRIMSSSDGGRSWSPVGVGIGRAGLWQRTAEQNDRLAIAARGGRVLAFANGNYGNDFIASIFLWELGGPSTVTLPRYFASDADQRQATWIRTWEADREPDEEAWIGVAVSGSSTVSLEAGYLEIEKVAATGAAIYTETLDEPITTAGIARGLIGRWTQNVVSGSGLGLNFLDVYKRFILDDGSDRITLAVTRTTTAARLNDYSSGSRVQVGTDVTGLTPGAEYEWMIAIETGYARVWYRPVTAHGEVAWIPGPEGSIGAAASTSAGVEVDWGAGWTSVTRWSRSATMYAEWVGTGLQRPWQSLRDAAGRPWPAVSSVLERGGSRLFGEGLTVRGDSWRLTGYSDTGLRNALRGGARNGWEAFDDGEQVIVWDLGTDDTLTTTDTLILAGFGSNVADIEIVGVKESGAETSLFDGPVYARLNDLAFDQRGRSVRVDVGEAAVDGPLGPLDDFAGDQWSQYDTGEAEWRSRVIAASREGRWSSGAGPKIALRLTEEIDTETGDDGIIVPRQWAVQVNMADKAYTQIKLRIKAASATVPAPAGGRWKVGRLFLGSATHYVHLPSWGNRVTHEPVEETLETRDGQREGIELAPTRRRFSLGFVDGTITYRVTDPASEGDPNWFEAHPSGPAAGFDGLELWTIDAIMRRTRGAREIVYLSDLKPLATYVHNRRDRVALVYFDSNTARERFAGLDLHTGEAVRGDVFELVEAT